MAAFVLFDREIIDVAIVETGLGGRWDATNVLATPDVSIITSIGLDHVQWLGHTEEKIAAEKAGIIKPQGDIISGVQGQAQTVIAAVARQQGARLRTLGCEFRAEAAGIFWAKGFQTIRYCASGKMAMNFPFGLLGAHQVDNAAVVLAAIETLREKGWTLPARAIDEGLLRIQWPGRFQIVFASTGPRLLLDGAHNPHGMQRLLQSIDESPWRHAPKTFIVATYRDKDYLPMIEAIARHAQQVVVCALPQARALPARRLQVLFRQHLPDRRVLNAQTPSRALLEALRRADRDGLVVVTGSLGLIGSLLPLLSRKRPLPSTVPQRVSTGVAYA